MAGPNVIRVAEFEPIPRPATLVTADLEDRLFAATAHVSFDVFRRNRRGFSAAGAVGLVDVGDVHVEILPKAGVLEPDPDGELGAELLLNLLSYAGLVARAVPIGGRVQKTRRPLAEAVARGFANGLVKELTDGVPRRYIERRERSTVLRGRLEMKELARRPVLVDGRLPVRYAPLHHDNELSQAIAATASVVAQLTRSSRTWSILRFCLAHLDDVRPPPLTPQLIARVQLTRAEERWRPVMDLGRLLAFGWRPLPVRGGLARTLTLVFPVHDLFEGVLRRALPRALAAHRVSLLPLKRGAQLLRSLETGRSVITLKPDYLFTDEDAAGVALVADAKWKVLEPSRTFGLEEDDAYQLVTYMTRHRLKRGVLFFPLRPWMLAGGKRTWAHRFELSSAPELRLALVGVDVSGLVARDPAKRKSAEELLGASLMAAVA